MREKISFFLLLFAPVHARREQEPITEERYKQLIDRRLHLELEAKTDTARNTWENQFKSSGLVQEMKEAGQYIVNLEHEAGGNVKLVDLLGAAKDLASRPGENHEISVRFRASNAELFAVEFGHFSGLPEQALLPPEPKLYYKPIKTTPGAEAFPESSRMSAELKAMPAELPLSPDLTNPSEQPIISELVGKVLEANLHEIKEMHFDDAYKEFRTQPGDSLGEFSVLSRVMNSVIEPASTFPGIRRLEFKKTKGLSTRKSLVNIDISSTEVLQQSYKQYQDSKTSEPILNFLDRTIEDRQERFSRSQLPEEADSRFNTEGYTLMDYWKESGFQEPNHTPQTEPVVNIDEDVRVSEQPEKTRLEKEFIAYEDWLHEIRITDPESPSTSRDLALLPGDYTETLSESSRLVSILKRRKPWYRRLRANQEPVEEEVRSVSFGERTVSYYLKPPKWVPSREIKDGPPSDDPPKYDGLRKEQIAFHEYMAESLSGNSLERQHAKRIFADKMRLLTEDTIRTKSHITQRGLMKARRMRVLAGKPATLDYDAANRKFFSDRDGCAACCNVQKRATSSCTEDEADGEWTENDENTIVTDDGVILELESQVSGRTVRIDRRIPSEYSAAKLMTESEAMWDSKAPSGMEAATEIAGKGNLYLGRVATALGFLNAAYMIQQGEYRQAAGSIAISTYFLAQDLGQTIKPLRNLIIKSTMKTSTALAEKIVSVGKVTDAAEAAARVARLGSELTEMAGLLIPIVGIAIGFYMVGEDWKRLAADDHKDAVKTAVLVVNLIIDTVLLAMMAVASEFPPLEIAVFVLTIFRMALESLVMSISKAMKNCHSTKYNCFVFGVGNFILNVFSLGFLNSANALKDSEAKNKRLVSDLNRVQSYFEMKGNCKGKVPAAINFNSGSMSSYGGDLTFHLMDNQDYKISLRGVPVYGKSDTMMHTIENISHCEMLRDVYMGLGETAKFSYKTEKGKMLFFIPIGRSFTLIKGQKLLDETMGGTYIGNSKDNTFYAVRGVSNEKKGGKTCGKLDTRDTTTKRASKYHYRLIGNGGNDKFILGPERTFVQGGEGSDRYSISSTGGDMLLDNFATDGLLDALFISTKRENINCEREENNLMIKYCGTHQVTVLNWFEAGNSEKHRHLTILSRNNDELGVFHDPSGNGYRCYVTTLDFSNFKDIDIDVEQDLRYRYVRKIISSRGHSIIKGNRLPNIVVAKGRDSFLMGRENSDQYIIVNKTKVTIDNCEGNENPSEDRILLPVHFGEIKAAQQDYSLLLYSHSGLGLTLHNWFKNESCQHATLLTTDKMVFGVQKSANELIIVPYIVDYSNYQFGVTANLKTHDVPGLSKGAILTNIKSIIASNHADHIVGNGLANMFVCRGGEDLYQGGGGADRFQMTPSCQGIIDLRSKDSKVTTVYLHCNYARFWVCPGSSNTEIHIVCLPSDTTNFHKKKLRMHCKKELVVWNWQTKKKASRVRFITKDGFIMEPRTDVSRRKHRKIVKVTALEINHADHFLCCNLNLNYEREQFGATIFKKHYLKNVISVKIDVKSKDSMIVGNSFGNSLHGGPKNDSYKSYLQGGNGSDQYIVAAGDGKVDINNFARDMTIDTLHLGIVFGQIDVAFNELDGTVLLFDTKEPKRTRVSLLNYWANSTNRHMVFIAADQTHFRLERSFPFKKVTLLDRSRSQFPSFIQPDERDKSVYGSVKKIVGSHIAPNVIFGTWTTDHISGGLMNDSIDGGPKGETLEGYDGDDIILGREGADFIKGGPGNDSLFGGPGDDMMYGGQGGDIIDGGPGFDFAVFQGGVGRTASTGRVFPTGVIISLRNGTGRGGDADSDYFSGVEVGANSSARLTQFIFHKRGLRRKGNQTKTSERKSGSHFLDGISFKLDRNLWMDLAEYSKQLSTDPNSREYCCCKPSSRKGMRSASSGVAKVRHLVPHAAPGGILCGTCEDWKVTISAAPGVNRLTVQCGTWRNEALNTKIFQLLF